MGVAIEGQRGGAVIIIYNNTIYLVIKLKL